MEVKNLIVIAGLFVWACLAVPFWMKKNFLSVQKVKIMFEFSGSTLSDLFKRVKIPFFPL